MQRLIDANALVKKYQGYMSDCATEEDFVSAEVFSDCITEIDAAPTVEPKRGEWIPVTNGRGGHKCSVCDDYAPSYQNGDEHLSKRCPNCGADMRKEVDQ